MENSSIFETHFQHVEIHQAEEFIIERFKTTSSEYTDETYKQDMLAMVDFLVKNSQTGIIRGSLADMRDLYFTISPELQEFQAEKAFSVALRMGLKRLAIVLSPDIFTAVSVEQSLEDTKNAPFLTRYFERYEEAYSWISENY